MKLILLLTLTISLYANIFETDHIIKTNDKYYPNISYMCIGGVLYFKRFHQHDKTIIKEIINPDANSSVYKCRVYKYDEDLHIEILK